MKGSLVFLVLRIRCKFVARFVTQGSVRDSLRGPLRGSLRDFVTSSFEFVTRFRYKFVTRFVTEGLLIILHWVLVHEVHYKGLVDYFCPSFHYYLLQSSQGSWCGLIFKVHYQKSFAQFQEGMYGHLTCGRYFEVCCQSDPDLLFRCKFWTYGDTALTKYVAQDNSHYGRGWGQAQLSNSNFCKA
jgi:hypothetical protein